MKKSDVVAAVFQTKLACGSPIYSPQHAKGLAFAPTNIALCKYWGKRDNDINLPRTSSLSIALPDKGALTCVTPHDKPTDSIFLNGNEIAADSAFAKRTKEFLDLFRPKQEWHLLIDIKMNVPVAAGLASSACGFASLVCALNDLLGWDLTKRELSILARLGSGSASRSLWMGFVEWHAGVLADGMDSYAESLPFEWREFRIGIIAINDYEKPISSREAMLRTVNSSMLYATWPKKVAQDMVIIKQALQVKNFSLLGGTAESNALSMHATMLSSWPPILYALPETVAAMHKIWDLRKAGLELYFTQDAGPNLKLLFLEKDADEVKKEFPQVEVIKTFD